MNITRRELVREFGFGVGLGALACIPIVIFRPGWVGIYAIGLTVLAAGVWVKTGLELVDKPDNELKPAGIRSRDRWRRFLARL